jgi:hypothetical protein
MLHSFDVQGINNRNPSLPPSGWQNAGNQSAGTRVTHDKIVPVFLAGRVTSSRRAKGMAKHQNPAQRETVERVMHEFKHGELKTAAGKRKVKNPKQAVAIALHEAGASKYESKEENKRNLSHTKAKERRGETYRDEAEGKSRSTRAKSRSGGSGDGKTKAQLYAEAKRRDLSGRSRMSKGDLERALHH